LLCDDAVGLFDDVNGA
jgi:hypothetical protein